MLGTAFYSREGGENDDAAFVFGHFWLQMKLESCFLVTHQGYAGVCQFLTHWSSSKHDIS